MMVSGKLCTQSALPQRKQHGNQYAGVSVSPTTSLNVSSRDLTIFLHIEYSAKDVFSYNQGYT